eukprot:m51a1_g10438 hypothetical protein (147) ;mRNA; r:1827-4675
MICLSGGSLRSNIALADVLSSEPYNVSLQDRLRNDQLMEEACCCKTAWSLHRLAQPPVEVLDALAQPPYSLTRRDARLCTVSLSEACRMGNVDAVRRLGQPPYCFGWDEARKDNCALMKSLRPDLEGKNLQLWFMGFMENWVDKLN